MKNEHKQKETTSNLQYFLSCELRSFILLCFIKHPTKQTERPQTFCAQFNNWKDISQIYTSVCVHVCKHESTLMNSNSSLYIGKCNKNKQNR